VNFNNYSVLVTGGSGMVGTSLKKILPNAFYISSRDCDFRDHSETDLLFKKIVPDFVIHLAAKVGGVKSNINQMGDFYYDNILINSNVLESSRKYNVKKVVSLLSTCIYPDNVNYPLTEEQIHNGPPHFSNYGYAYAKRMLDVHSRAYRNQYGCNFITAVPNNLFGENDNYDLENSHVIPAIIRKIHESKINNEDLHLWGDGSPLREFTYSYDLAKILLFLLEKYDEPEPINVGNTYQYSILNVAEKISKILNFDGNIIWNKNAPSGQHKKPSSNIKLINLGWKKENYTSFDTSLRKSCEWFLEKYPLVRGI
jgi:GDP-L-fucose synthase